MLSTPSKLKLVHCRLVIISRRRLMI